MRSKLAAICHEPLVHFLAIGAGFFLLWHWLGDRVASQPQRIVITPGHVERLAQQWTRTHLRPPNAEELAGLLEQEIDKEILYQEAVAMGLDRDDLVIRRRLAVKMDFLTEDVAAVATPTDEQLQTFLSQHPDKFHVESLTSFAQVYINRAQRGEGSSVEAARVLVLLRDNTPTDWQALGDPLPLSCEYEAAPDAEVARRFGREFAGKLAGLPVGHWSGPVESTYGLHLVLVRPRIAGRLPPLEEVRDAVLSEWRAARRQELNEDLRLKRRGRYSVTVQWPEWASESATVTSKSRPAQGQGGPP
jgi:hypothetical protein